MIVRYLAGSVDKGIIVPKRSKDQKHLRCYVDADFAGLFNVDPSADSTSVKSRTGYIIFLGPWPLIWKSFLQTEVSLSTLEAEYCALSSATRTLLPIIFLLKLMIKIVDNNAKFKSIFHVKDKELKDSYNVICRIFEDNNGAWTVAKNQRVTSRTKYFQVKWHHFWQHVKNNTLQIERVNTEDQWADYLTKGITHELFGKNCKSVQGW